MADDGTHLQEELARVGDSRKTSLASIFTLPLLHGASIVRDMVRLLYPSP